ncbi:MBOAT family O-acyltransferase [Tahibacter amnicola]|uniref:Probable alginate O-acetylase n=1 Tax=Tahibacter amnicola TaxID=2976241 RepID=A0ABY6BHP0_9GAMM|nr:MBOAT family O-acyltransferase [Tahibacter amnicola]UXI69514.1 MBOAT family protein [Tahibacter amnicola]
MQFDSFTFLLFFAIVLLVYNAVGAWSWRKNVLLVASYAFYAAWNPPFLLLLAGSTTLDWWIARRIDAQEDPRRRRTWLVLTLLLNFGVLGYFKYSGFLLDNLAQLLAVVGITYKPPPLGIILPIGISFYTFHSVSYCIDVYRRKFAPTGNWRDYALYVAFFPQLVAGPIVRWTQMRDQIETARRSTVEGLGLGLSLLVIGLFQKVALADAVFAPVADALFKTPTEAGTADAWIGLLAFSGQIFCDFAGYSTCAIGAALALGFSLPINFRSPYAAIGFSDFWRRWHISLSSWLRDYLYVSLGGNRGGRWRTYRNLMLTMLIGGLWHGAAWTFVIWGGLHGLFLALERALRETWFARYDDGALARFAYGMVTLLGAVYAWLWFRAGSLQTGWELHHRLFSPFGAIADALTTRPAQHLALLVFVAVVAVQWLMRERDLQRVVATLPAVVRGVVLGLMLWIILLSPGDNHAFIYFQF